MTHPVILKTQALILAGEIEEAESSLAVIADQEGDHALVSVLDDMAPKDVLAIMREFDSSRESVVNMLISPEQFVQAIILEYQYGEPLEDYVQRLRSTMNAVLFRSDASCAEVLESLAEHDEGIRVLADYFIDHYGALLSLAAHGEFQVELDLERLLAPKSVTTWDPERVDELDQGLEGGDAMELARVRVLREEAADADWMETAWVLRHEFDDVFGNLIEEIRQRLMRAHEAEQLAARGESAAPSDAPAQDDEESAI